MGLSTVSTVVAYNELHFKRLVSNEGKAENHITSDVRNCSRKTELEHSDVMPQLNNSVLKT